MSARCVRRVAREATRPVPKGAGFAAHAGTPCVTRIRGGGAESVAWPASFARALTAQVQSAAASIRTASSRAGSNGERSTVDDAPSQSSSAIARPLAGAFSMPQQLWPVAT